MPCRSDILIWPSLKHSLWRPFSVGLLISFCHSSPLMLLGIGWHSIPPSKSLRSLQTFFFQKYFANPIVVSTIFFSHRLENPAVTSRLRKPTVYPRPSLHTKRYCSTVSHGLLNFQNMHALTYILLQFYWCTGTFVVLRCILLYFIAYMSICNFLNFWNNKLHFNFVVYESPSSDVL